MASPVHPDALGAARAGAGWAFERIYTELAGPVCGYLRSQGVEDPDGETNEVFLRAFKRLGSFTGDADALRSWVFTIAHNHIIDSRRFRSRRPKTDPTSDERRLDRPQAADAEDRALARLGDERLRRQLDLLVPDQRDVLLLRFVADLSLEDVAAAMGRTVGAVKALQHRALASVRRNLGEILPEAVSPHADPTLTGV